MSASARLFANEALRLLTLPEIPYRYSGTTLAGMDCQGAVKYCAQQLGVRLNYSGSNDMFRNACSWVGTLAEARAQRRIVPGAVGFIVESSGGEGLKYRGDGIGDASHIGIITLAKEAYSVDASQSAGKVRARDERDAVRVWTHIGWLKDIDYGGESNHQPESTIVIDEIVGTSVDDDVPWPTVRMARVFTPDGGALNLRRAPSNLVDNRVGRAPHGEVVEVLETRPDGWAKVHFQGIDAWVQTRYLQLIETSGGGD